MAAVFKNKLCQALRPDSWNHYYEHLCKRHAGHSGEHRVCYSDAVVTWNDGDKSPKITKKKSA